METTITTTKKTAFDAASRLFVAAPNADTMTLLEFTMRAMVQPDSVIRFSKRWEAPTTGQEFNCIRITTTRTLTDEESVQVTGALNYAMATYVGVEELTATRVVHGKTYSIMEFDTDSRERRRTAPDYSEAFREAERFIREGSPVRKTNRAGVGTEGTRLCEGIGEIGLKVEVYPA